MLRLAVCDDDKFVVEQIESYIEQLKELSIVYEVYFSAEEFYSHMFELDFDVYFLDIEIADKSGIELAKKIRQTNQYAVIVFITSYSKYVIDVYDVVSKLLKQNIAPIFSEARVGDIRDSNADISKAMKDLGYNPKYMFEEGIKLTVKWYEQNEK